MRLRPVKACRALAIIAGLGILPFRAFALTPLTTATFAVSGTIIGVESGADILGPSVQAGTPFTAVFRVDGPGQDLYADMPDVYRYVDQNPANNADLQFGDYTLGPGNPNIALNSVSGNLDSLPTIYEWDSEGSQGSGLVTDLAQVKLTDSTGTALSAKGFPPVGPGVSDISRWDYTWFFYKGHTLDTGKTVLWTGQVNAISTSAIPEPGSLSMLATGLLPLTGLLFRRRAAR